MSELIDCWKHGVKVLPGTKCSHFEEGKTCGDHPDCFYKSRVAKWQHFEAKKHNPAGDVEENEVEEKHVENVDDAFW